MSEKNEVPSDQMQSELNKTVKKYDEALRKMENEGTSEPTVQDYADARALIKKSHRANELEECMALEKNIATALSALRASWEKEREELVNRAYKWMKLEENSSDKIESLEAEKKGLLVLNDSLTRTASEKNSIAIDRQAEIDRLKAKVAELTAELQATRKACDQAHQNTLDREEERDRLKAENVELRKTEDAVLGWTHPNFKWYADKIDTLTSRLSCALEALKKILRVCRLRKKWMNPTLAESELKKCTEEIEAESVLTSPDNLRMVEMEKAEKRLLKAFMASYRMREKMKKAMRQELSEETLNEFDDAELKSIDEELEDALEAYESRGKV